jgi:hypothetical protein
MNQATVTVKLKVKTGYNPQSDEGKLAIKQAVEQMLSAGLYGVLETLVTVGS